MIIRNNLAPLALALAALVSLAACGGSATTPSSAPVTTAKPAASGPALASGPPTTSAPVLLNQAWAQASLVDVTTGESFRLNDLAGKVIIVETMAIWCTNCKVQQANVEKALQQLPADRVAYVLFDVDPNEDAASLAAYRERHSYTGRYVIATTEVAQALAAEFGNQFLSPPSTPIVMISVDGTVTPTDFGQKSAEDIVALALAGGA